MTIAQQLAALEAEKQAQKSALSQRGIAMGDVPFTRYHEKIAELSGGGETRWQPDPRWVALPPAYPETSCIYMVVAVERDLPWYGVLARSQGRGPAVIDWGDGQTTVTTGEYTACHHQYDYDALPTAEIDGHYKTALVTITPDPDLPDPRLDRLELVLSPPEDLRYGSERSHPLLAIRGNADGLYNRLTFHLPDYPGYVCDRLEFVDLQGTGAITDTSFRGCAALVEIRRFDFAGCGDLSFHSCGNLRRIGEPIDARKFNTLSYLFYNCHRLEAIPPLLNTGGCTSTSYLFYGCHAIREVPLFDTAAVTSAAYMFAFCSALEALPAYDFSSLTSAANLAQNCVRLRSVAIADFPALTNLSNAFNGCLRLEGSLRVSSPLLTNITNALTNSKRLEEVSFHLNSFTATAFSPFSGNYDLRRVRLSGIPSTLTTIGGLGCTRLSRQALVELFHDLPDRTGLSAGKLDRINLCTGYPLLDDADKRIALDKNWAV